MSQPQEWLLQVRMEADPRTADWSGGWSVENPGEVASVASMNVLFRR